MTRQRSSATLLAAAFAGVVAYASLFPFAGWRLPGGSGWGWWRLPWPAWFPQFDITANLLGYLPLGALVYVAAVRTGRRVATAFAAALLSALALSYTLEVLQQFLPARVPSSLDLLLNVAGALAGAMLGALAHALGALERWQAWRDRWFVRHSAAAIALLLLWPLGLLFPTPVPLGMGQVWDEARGWAMVALDGTPWADAAHGVLAPPAGVAGRPTPLVEAVAVALGLLAPCLIAYTVSPPGWRRVALALGAAAVAVGTMTLATALNFGPENALAWWTPAAGPGLAAGLVVALLCMPAGRRLVAGIALVVLTGLVAVVAMAPTDAYYAHSLQDWQQGRFIRFHGLAQWIGWVWPYAALAWLLTRLARRDEPV